MKLSQRILNMSWSALIAALLSFSMTATLSGAMGMSVSYVQIALFCLCAAIVCGITAINTVTTLSVIGLGLAGGVYCWRAHIDIGSQLSRLFQELSRLLLTAEPDKPVTEPVYVLILIALVLSLLSLLMTRIAGGVYPATLLLVFVLMGAHFMEYDLPLWTLIPGLAALAVLYARAFRENTTVTQALPAAILSAVLALVLAGVMPDSIKPLQDAADKVRELFNDYFMFNDARIVYTVASDGYQPLIDLLGGPASPRHEDVMSVKTDESMLLRGSVSRTYTGRNWTDDTVNSRYLYLDPTRVSKRNGAFDTDLIGNLRGQVHRSSASVTFLNSGTSTLFVPQRMIDLNTSYDTPAYYNETGEVFITRDVAYGDSYSFDVWLPNGSLETLGPAVNRASTLRDDDYETVYAEYTALPSGISEDLYWLLQDVIDGRESTYEKALAIRDYLRGQDFVYTIDARYPPEGEDFVSWFVLQERRGYCTYYASAMAVMARLCGIPARYCEGYAVRANGQDSVIVTGMDAHAWAELYFRGVGWIAFDATPTDNVGDGDMDGSEREQPNSDNSQRPESNQGQEPVQNPEPSPPPSELPSSPEAVQQPTPTPEANPNSQTPQPDGEPESEPDNTQNVETDDGQTDSDDDSRQDRPSPRWPWILLLVIAAILGTGECLRRRYNANSPERISTREKDDAVRAMVWYRSVLGLLAILGFVPQGGETPAGLAARAVSSDNVPEEIITLSQAIERLQYGREKISQEAERLGGYVYTYILTHLPKRDRVKWRLHIMRRGIGDYHRIP